MAKPRPLSPHLQIYRPQLTSVMSISHRASGAALAAGTLLLCLWLVALAAGDRWYGVAALAVSHPLGQLVLFGYSVALIYHALNGVRHLSWDRGIGLTIPAVYRSGWIVLLLTVGITALLWTIVI
jgi:succinate dehydrogenase / fumarate reductase cytochrome b subunit